MKPLVYIAAPYTHPDPLANTHRVIRVATELLDGGLVAPVVPHLNLFWHLVTPRRIEAWYAYDYDLLARCDYLLRLTGESTGADHEVKEAEQLGIPVVHSISALYDLAGEWEPPTR